MLPMSLTLAVKLFAIGFAASAALVAARTKGPHALFATGVLLALDAWLVAFRVGEFGIPIDSGRYGGYMLTLGWFAIGCLPATLAVHLASVWRVGWVSQSVIGAAVLAPALLMGVNYWVT